MRYGYFVARVYWWRFDERGHGAREWHLFHRLVWEVGGHRMLFVKGLMCIEGVFVSRTE